MDYQNAALFGDRANTSMIPSAMMNQFTADGSTDWGAVITNGIRGAADGAIRGLVSEKFQDQQLKAQQTQAAIAQRSMLNLVVIGAILFVVLK